MKEVAKIILIYKITFTNKLINIIVKNYLFLGVKVKKVKYRINKKLLNNIK